MTQHKTYLPDSANINESDDHSESSNVSYQEESHEDGTLEGEDQENTEAPRRSTRERKAPTEWRKAAALSSIVLDQESSFNAATKGEESQAWKSAIRR